MKGAADMYKKLIFIVVLLLACIAMMVSALLMSAETFAKLSSYFSLVCVALSIVGVVLIIRNNKKNKKDQ